MQPPARLVLLLLLPPLLSGCGRSGSDTGTEPSTPEAMYARVQELLKPSAEREGPDVAGAMHWLTKAAEAGYLPAQVDLGGMYLEGGKGVERDGAKSLEWFTKAAEQGNMQSYIFMGRILYSGLGVDADPETAMEYWQKAAQAGIPEADYYLGSALVRYLPTMQDGIEHLKVAATQVKGRLGASAAAMLGTLYQKGAGDIPADAGEALHWYRVGAKAGDSRAQLVYALMLLTGTSVEKDERQGMAYLRMSAGQDNPRAIATLINLLRNSDDEDGNEAEVEAWEKRLESLRRVPQGDSPEVAE